MSELGELSNVLPHTKERRVVAKSVWTLSRSAARARHKLCVAGVERNGAATALEEAVVPPEVADKREMREEAGVAQHPPGVSADGKHLAGFDIVVLIEHEPSRAFCHGPTVDDGLPLVFAGRLKLINLEQAIGC